MHTNFIEPMISVEQLKKRVSELAGLISADYPDSSNAPELRLIGVLKGSFVFLADLMRQIKRDVSIDFLSVSSYGNSTRSSRNPKIQQDLTCEISGLDVVLVEDIVDTGTTLKHIYDVLEQRKPHSLRTVALLDKPSRRVTQISPSYVGFKISDKFVVGYGLDYSQHFRNRPDICSLVEDSTQVS